MKTFNLPDAPCDGDYVVTSNGFAYSLNHAVPGFSPGSPMEDVVKLIRQQMDREQFWPDVWFVSDHGNLNLLAVAEDGSYSYVTA